MRKIKNVFKNISYTISSNLVSLIVSAIVTLFLPKVLGIDSYGYYQLYLFYVSYVGFLHFGWCDGIYLKYGGDDYESLNYSTFRGQYFSLLAVELVISFFFSITVLFSSIANYDKQFVLLAAILNIILLNMRTFGLYILQTTNRMRDYSQVTILDRVVYIILVLVLMLSDYKNFHLYIMMDLLARTVSLIVLNLKIKEISLSFNDINWSLKESIDNIKVGMNLMIANLASILIIGIVRFGVQVGWDISTFGKVSLTLNISNMLMVFINAISLAIFPIIKREKTERYADIYIVIRTILMPLVLILLLIFYPLKLVLSYWIPNYYDSIYFMSIVFPIVIFESKVSLLTNTYLKALRKETSILKVNILTMLLSIGITILSTQYLHNIEVTMISIVCLLGCRSLISEYVLTRVLDIDIFKDVFLETGLVVVFIISNLKLSFVMSFCVYLFSILVYLYIKRHDINMVITRMKNIVGNEID